MVFRRLLVFLHRSTTATPTGASGAAVDIAVTFNAKISALSCAILPQMPKSILSGAAGTLSALVTEERRKIAAEARHLLQSFSELAKQRGVLGQAIYRQCAPAEVPDLLAGYARVNDLLVMPMPEGASLDRLDSHWYLETALFDSGHPVLILPPDHRSQGAGAFGTIVVAWDQSRAAARALTDAMPMLRLAKSVRLLTVTNEKVIPDDPPPLEVVSHLAAHDIRVAYDAVDADGRDAATVILEYLRERSADVLVMGGYGHSRARELMLGGATRSMLRHPPLPILMSH